MRKLAIAGNILVVLGLVYALVINGVLSFWADESGMGIMLNNYNYIHENFEGDF